MMMPNEPKHRWRDVTIQIQDEQKIRPLKRAKPTRISKIVSMIAVHLRSCTRHRTVFSDIDRDK